MSRRRTTKKPPTIIAAKDEIPLGHHSEAELIAEIARRRMKQGASLEDFELRAEATGEHLGEEVLAQAIAALLPENGRPKHCGSAC